MSTLDVKVEQQLMRSKYFEAKENHVFSEHSYPKTKTKYETI